MVCAVSPGNDGERNQQKRDSLCVMARGISDRPTLSDLNSGWVRITLSLSLSLRNASLLLSLSIENDPSVPEVQAG